MSRHRRSRTVSLVLLLLAASTVSRAERPVVVVPGTDLGLPFSPAVWSGDLLFLSGAIGNTPGTLEIEGDIAAQTRRTVANLQEVLRAAHLDLDRVVSADIYLADLREFPEFWGAMRSVMPGAIPAGAAVEADIAIPRARLEMGFVAVRPGVEILAVQPEGWAEPTGGGTWAIRAGNALFPSGMASFDPATGDFVDGDLATQTRQTLRNLGGILEAAGFESRDLVRCRVFLPDPRDYAEMNDAYGAFFEETPPARATVRARLLHPDALIGVQCLAVRGAGRHAVRPKGAEPSARPFSPAIAVGNRLFLSGMVGRGRRGFGDTVAEQTRITLRNLESTLKAAGLSFDDVTAATVYLADIRHYRQMNEVYGKVVGTPAPARATVGAPLMSPDALVEIQMTATRSSE